MNREPSDKEIRDLFSSQCGRFPEVIAAIEGENLGGYPTTGMNLMEHGQLNRLAALNGVKDPDYKNDPIRVYAAAQRQLGVTFCDQWIPDNPLSMGDEGFETKVRTATTGAETVVLDGMEINEPEDVVAHLEKVVFPRLREQIEHFDTEARVREIGLGEYRQQTEMGLDILKTGYGFVTFPFLGYYDYGYVNYFTAYALYEDVMDEHFRLQAELSRKNNEAAAIAYNRYALPKLYRLDHDMTDSRNTLVSLRSLERIWFPRLAYCLEPILAKTDVRLIWHCDGAITPMIHGLIDAGIRGFQGFQYEDGVDYAGICNMRGRDGKPLFIIGGASVTTVLPHGTPDDVRAHLKFLVDAHGSAALTLGSSSSITPGVPAANLDALIEGIRYYATHRS